MDYGNISEIKDLLNSIGFRASKSLGQNFLTDPNIPGKIVRESGIDSSCGVLEAGPGLGALTAPLSRVAKRVISVELDTRLVAVLNDMFSKTPNVAIVNADILKLDIAGMIRQTEPELKWHVCSNLPYSITTPALSAFMNCGAFDSITVMIQKEVALRICAKPGSSAYSSFTVFANYHSLELRTLFDVPPECFMPRPGVYSTVIRMKQRESRLLEKDDEALFFRVVKAAFGQRRKTLVNALYASGALLTAQSGKIEKEELERIVTSCGFDARVRGETLGVDEFIGLTGMLKKYIKM